MTAVELQSPLTHCAQANSVELHPQVVSTLKCSQPPAAQETTVIRLVDGRGESVASSCDRHPTSDQQPITNNQSFNMGVDLSTLTRIIKARVSPLQPP